MSKVKKQPPKTAAEVKKDYGKQIGKDLFGEPVYRNVKLRERFIEPPFTVLNSETGEWRTRKAEWKALGIQSELGREELLSTSMRTEWMARGSTEEGGSIFDPALCELLYFWFCPPGGKILDPFAGGSVRGIVAAHCGYIYNGIDIRPEQVEHNELQAKEILTENYPKWLTGDSNIILDGIANNTYDLLFSCPPYADTEKYSSLPGDVSNMKYPEFIEAYGSIISKAVAKVKTGGMAVFVVGEVRDKTGHYYGFVPDTISLFEQAGMKFYNEAILLTSRGSGVLRARQFVASQKLVKCHQNILGFVKI